MMRDTKQLVVENEWQSQRGLPDSTTGQREDRKKKENRQEDTGKKVVHCIQEIYKAA